MANYCFGGLKCLEEPCPRCQLMHPQPGRVSLQCCTALAALDSTHHQTWASSASAPFHHRAINEIHLQVSKCTRERVYLWRRFHAPWCGLLAFWESYSVLLILSLQSSCPRTSWRNHLGEDWVESLLQFLAQLWVLQTYLVSCPNTLGKIRQPWS